MRIIRTEIKPFTMQESGRGAAEGDSSNNDLSDLGYHFLTGVGLPSLYGHRLPRRMGTGGTRSNSSDKDVLPCRQVTIVALALGKACDVLAID
jgi:hypothetical protein